MSDSTANLDPVSQAVSQREVQINALVDALSPSSIFGRRASTCAGLVFGYYGGEFTSANVVNGTVTATASNTNYVVVHRTTLVVSISTSNSNWNDTATYGRAYLLTAGASSITSYVDHRMRDNGILLSTGGGAASGSAGGDLTGTYPNPTLAATAVTLGTYGSATKTVTFTVDAKGRLTAAAEQTATPAVGSITGFGTGVATWLATPSSANLASAITDETGSGALVFANTPTLVTPVLGVATATSVNGNILTTGTWTLTGTAGKTLTFSNSITLAGTDSTTMTFPPASASIGYLNVPQNSQSTAYTTVLADAGKHLLHPAADTNARTFTIDSNANVAYPIGTAITFVNETSQVVSIAITSDTLTLAGSTTTGTRSLAQNGMATALKVTSTKWIISGTGLT